MGDNTMNKEEIQALKLKNKTRAQQSLIKHQQDIHSHKKQYRTMLTHPLSWYKKYKMLRLAISNMQWVIEYCST